MKKQIVYLLFLGLCLNACSTWLDVTPRGDETLEQMITSYRGIKDILTGCYIKLNSRSIYGENLTMSHVEALAQMWAINQSTSQRDADKAFAIYDYENIYAKNAISSIYLNLYNVIVQANTIILNLEPNRHVITDPVALGIIKGEVYAIRALCHLDVLRLFGQMPNHPSRQVSLPYAETVSSRDLPRYYSYEHFIKKIEDDLLVAEDALKEIDPVFTMGMTSNSNSDDFLNYRGHYLNYYAVKALQARLYLYTNQTDKAYAAAKVVYDAQPVKLSAMEDFSQNFLACPGECIFALSNNSLMDYSRNVVGQGTPNIQEPHLYLTNARLTELFDNISDNRRMYVWNRSSINALNTVLPVIKKYWYDIGIGYSNEQRLLKLDIIPMIRMCEIYFILMETSTLAEANKYYQEYMQSARSVIVDQEYTAEELQTIIVNEIRREFFAEGHMFYTYKRLGVKNMMWGEIDMSENEYERYIVPLPDSEFDPA